MDKCAGCGRSVKVGSSFQEEINGLSAFFCCRGCRRLYEIKINQNHGNKTDN